MRNIKSTRRLFNFGKNLNISDYGDVKKKL